MSPRSSDRHQLVQLLGHLVWQGEASPTPIYGAVAAPLHFACGALLAPLVLCIVGVGVTVSSLALVAATAFASFVVVVVASSLASFALMVLAALMQRTYPIAIRSRAQSVFGKIQFPHQTFPPCIARARCVRRVCGLPPCGESVHVCSLGACRGCGLPFHGGCAYIRRIRVVVRSGNERAAQTCKEGDGPTSKPAEQALIS